MSWKNRLKKIFLFSLSFFFLSLIAVSCYTLKGTSVPLDVNTFSVQQFEIKALNAPPTLSQVFTERLKTKMLNETRLSFNRDSPDVEFLGAITDYRVSSVAPQAGATTAFNQLDVVVAVEYINHKNEQKNWKSSFNRFYQFPSDANLFDKQDGYIKVINELLVEDIFKRSFEDW